jgi:hypothetical protein
VLTGKDANRKERRHLKQRSPIKGEEEMKKVFCARVILVTFLMVFVVTAMAMADQVMTVGGGGYGPYQTGRGGEFTFQVLDPNLNWILSSYVPGTTSDLVGGTYLHNFQTFCVEEGEYLYPWTRYDVTISDHSMYTNKVLTRGAAGLYYQFARGQLPGYDYTRTASGENETQELQEAIWYFMGSGGAFDPNNEFMQLGASYGGLVLNGGRYPVAVLNLWAPGQSSGTGYQDQLVCTPTPEPSTMLLLGSGLLGLVGYRRRIFFKK